MDHEAQFPKFGAKFASPLDATKCEQCDGYIFFKNEGTKCDGARNITQYKLCLKICDRSDAPKFMWLYRNMRSESSSNMRPISRLLSPQKKLTPEPLSSNPDLRQSITYMLFFRLVSNARTRLPARKIEGATGYVLLILQHPADAVKKYQLHSFPRFPSAFTLPRLPAAFSPEAVLPLAMVWGEL